MKVLALNSSSRMERGGTAFILSPFLEGLKERGAEVELLYVSKLNIKPCLACGVCWVKTPGRCAQRDDMDTVMPKIVASDFVVLATPVYFDGMTGPMKMLVDRLIPLVEASVLSKEGHTRHPARKRARNTKLALVSVCGFPELDNFDPLLTHVKAIAKNLDMEFVGAILRPYAGASYLRSGTSAVDFIGVLEAAREVADS